MLTPRYCCYPPTWKQAEKTKPVREPNDHIGPEGEAFDHRSPPGQTAHQHVVHIAARLTISIKSDIFRRAYLSGHFQTCSSWPPQLRSPQSSLCFLECLYAVAIYLHFSLFSFKGVKNPHSSTRVMCLKEYLLPRVYCDVHERVYC